MNLGILIEALETELAVMQEGAVNAVKRPGPQSKPWQKKQEGVIPGTSMKPLNRGRLGNLLKTSQQNKKKPAPSTPQEPTGEAYGIPGYSAGKSASQKASEIKDRMRKQAKLKAQQPAPSAPQAPKGEAYGIPGFTRPTGASSKAKEIKDRMAKQAKLKAQAQASGK